jgi:ABC-type transporter Mla subunit MlaD
MPLQDLTPQLRTRLNKMERAVGGFVFLAAALLLFGFGCYLYNKAQSNGWFLVKARFFTYTDSASGLKIGDPVTLMGFKVGQISGITAMPPRTRYNVRIEFYVNQVNQNGEPYFGYVWNEGSVVKVNASDFLGSRSLEITRGTNGYGVYSTRSLETLSLEKAQTLADPGKWRLAENIYDENSNLVLHAYVSLAESNVTRMIELKHEPVLAFHMPADRHHIVAIWNNSLQRYQDYDYRDGDETNAYRLRAAESPAVTDQLQAMITQAQNALPGILSLTNQIAAALDNANATLGNAALATSNLNVMIVSAQPLLTNFALISDQLRAPGGLALWALGADSQLQLANALTNANSLMANADTNLLQLTAGIGQTLDNLANITSNLNAQVQSNSNLLGGLSKTVTDADDFVQGLKRHWLLRSAFKTEETNETKKADSSIIRLKSPRDASN